MVSSSTHFIEIDDVDLFHNEEFASFCLQKTNEFFMSKGMFICILPPSPLLDMSKPTIQVINSIGKTIIPKQQTKKEVSSQANRYLAQTSSQLPVQTQKIVLVNKVQINSSPNSYCEEKAQAA